MNRRTVTRGIISLALMIGALTFMWFRFFYVPNYPGGVAFESKIYLINPETILASLDQGESNVFLEAPLEPDEGWPQLWPPGSFAWEEKDYLRIADALHQFVWKEPLDDWHIIRASFLIDQCLDIVGHIDSADLSLQHQDDRNDVHSIFINPIDSNIYAGEEYYYSNDWGYPNGWTASSIDLDHVKINSVATALQVAEENGGREARSSVKNECRITLLLAPDRIKYDFFSNPFTRYGWGWSVIYLPNESNADPIFETIIDPYTGRFEMPRSK